MSSYKGTRERVRDLERAVEGLEEQFSEVVESVDNLRTVTEEVLKTLETLSGSKSPNGSGREPEGKTQLESIISEFSSTLGKSSAGKGDLGSLLGSLLGPGTSRTKDLVPVDPNGNYGKLTSAAIKLTDSIQLIATTAQQLLPLLILVDRVQESDFFKKIMAHLNRQDETAAQTQEEEQEKEEEDGWQKSWPPRRPHGTSPWGRQK